MFTCKQSEDRATQPPSIIKWIPTGYVYVQVGQHNVDPSLAPGIYLFLYITVLPQCSLTSQLSILLERIT